MKKLKNVGAGPVSAQKEAIDSCPEFLKRSKQKNIGCSSAHSNFKGITLIALIITVIVMLILVGVTINVALNGGLFDSADYAATETKKEAEKEQLLSAVVGAIGTDGKIDSTKISLPEGFQKDDSKSTGTKLVVKGKDTLWQIDLISAKVEPYTVGDTYTFTIGELGSKGLLVNDGSGPAVLASNFWRNDVSDDLKKSTFVVEDAEGNPSLSFTITCSDSKFYNCLESGLSPEGNCFGFYSYKDENDNNDYVYFFFVADDTVITNDNYAAYADISFTISK